MCGGVHANRGENSHTGPRGTWGYMYMCVGGAYQQGRKLTHRTSGDLGVHVYVCGGCIPAGTKTHTQDLGGPGGTLHICVGGVHV